MTDSTPTIITPTPTQTVKVTYDGKTYDLSIEFTQDDDVLRQILSASGLAGAANALVERQPDGDILLVKRGGPNGVLLEAEPDVSTDLEVETPRLNLTAAPDSIVAGLLNLEPHINPTVQMDWELRQQEWRGTLTLTDLLLQQGAISKALEDGKAEYALVTGIESRLGQCGSIPDQRAPGVM